MRPNKKVLPPPFMITLIVAASYYERIANPQLFTPCPTDIIRYKYCTPRSGRKRIENPTRPCGRGGGSR